MPIACPAAGKLTERRMGGGKKRGKRLRRKAGKEGRREEGEKKMKTAMWDGWIDGGKIPKRNAWRKGGKEEEEKKLRIARKKGMMKVKF